MDGAQELRWDGIIGHERNIARLRTMLRDGRLSHALLFAGLAGVGKRKTAQVLAAAFLCRGKDAPCGACPSCRALLAGTHPDYIELAPELRGKGTRLIRVDDVRRMERAVSRKPMLSGRFAVLVDEAETMNEAAANALLKTLEEPPGETLFILVTARPAALLPTILSRLSPVRFGALTPEEIEDALAARGVESAAARALAAAADGSLGQALALQEEGGLALADDAAKTLLSLDDMDMFRLWEKAEQLGKLPREGAVDWLRALARLLRDMLALYAGAGVLYHEERRQELAGRLVDFPEARIFSQLAFVQETIRRFRSNASPPLLFEGLLLRLKDA